MRREGGLGWTCAWIFPCSEWDYSRLLSILVFSGCYNKLPLQIYLTVLEAGSWRLGCQHIRFCLQNLFQFADFFYEQGRKIILVGQTKINSTTTFHTCVIMRIKYVSRLLKCTVECWGSREEKAFSEARLETSRSCRMWLLLIWVSKYRRDSDRLKLWRG
jgi:hypothetical protein